MSVIVTIYNEESVLEQKLKNFRELEYPVKYLEFILGSDGSTDRTAEILNQIHAPNYKTRTFTHRRGKVSLLNDLILESTGDILVLTDANTFFFPDTLDKLVRHFINSDIGAVCGELILEADDQTAGGFGEGFYWKYDNMLKHLESDIDTMIGATGGIYAIRRELFVPLPTDRILTDDFLVPLNVIKKGKKIVYDQEAKAIEKSTNSVEGEFKRKSRISASNFQTISEFSSLLSPKYGFAAFSLWSRKIIRWLVPFFMLILIVASFLLYPSSVFYRNMFFLEIVFLAMGFIGFVFEQRKVNIGFLGIPYYFIAMNMALFVGFFRFLLKRQQPTWDVVR